MQAIAREPGLVAPSMEAMHKVEDIYGKVLIQNSKDKGVVRTDISNELLMEYYLAVTERFKMRWMERYVDFTAEPAEEQKRTMNEESV